MPERPSAMQPIFGVDVPEENEDPDREYSASDITVADQSVIKRAVGAAAIGNITEWYDFGVYGYLTTTISQVYFSGLPHSLSIIATFGLFAVSFLVRPLGGLFFGPLGDKIGRKRVLSLTVIMMALGTFALGIIPSYAAIGVAAPLLALLARLVQGFSTGGEYGSAMTFIAEYAPDRRRGFFGSWLEFGTMTGYALGAGVATVLTTTLSEEALMSWGWRVPFLVALPIGIIGLYLRKQLEETPAFAKMLEVEENEQSRSALRELRTVFTKYWPAMLLCGGFVLAWNVTNYMLTSYMPTYLTETLPAHGHPGAGETASQVLQIAVLVLLMVIMPFLGRLIDRVGHRRIVLVGSASLIVLAAPSLMLIRGGGAVSTFFGLALMGWMLACFSSTMPSALPALFPTAVRSGSLSIAFNISVSLFGGTTSTVMGALVTSTGDLNWPVYYLVAAGFVGLVCVTFMRESSGKPLKGSGPTVTSEQEARELVRASAA